MRNRVPEQAKEDVRGRWERYKLGINRDTSFAKIVINRQYLLYSLLDTRYEYYAIIDK